MNNNSIIVDKILDDVYDHVEKGNIMLFNNCLANVVGEEPPYKKRKINCLNWKYLNCICNDHNICHFRLTVSQEYKFPIINPNFNTKNSSLINFHILHCKMINYEYLLKSCLYFPKELLKIILMYTGDNHDFYNFINVGDILLYTKTRHVDHDQHSNEYIKHIYQMFHQYNELTLNNLLYI